MTESREINDVTEHQLKDSASECRTIWAVSEYYWPNFSGAAIQAQQILCRLAQQGYRVHVLSAADQQARSLTGTTREIDGVTVHYLPVVGRQGWSSLARIPRLQTSLRAANNMLRDRSFHRQVLTILQSQSRPGDVIQWYIVGDATWSVMRHAHRYGWRNVIQVSLLGSDDPASFQPTLLGQSTRRKLRCFHHADYVIGLSRALVESCLRCGLSAERVVRIPNGVDTSRFRPTKDRARDRVRVGLDPLRRYVAFVGSAIHRKGIDVALPAFLGVCQEIDDVDLLIIGPCDFADATRHDAKRQILVNQLRDRAAAAGMADRIHWVGEVSNVPDYLAASELFLFPTRREGLPNAMAEAMACGLPVLASRLEGITTDLVHDGVEGRLVSGHGPGDYAAALAELLNDADNLSRMGRAARGRIEREFDLQKIVPQYAALYDALASLRS